MKRIIFSYVIVVTASFYLLSCNTDNTNIAMKQKEYNTTEKSDVITVAPSLNCSKDFPITTHFKLSEEPNLSLIKISPFCRFKSDKERSELNEILPELSRLKGVQHEIIRVEFAWDEITITAKIQINDTHDVILVKDLKTNKWNIVYVVPVYH